MASDDLIAAMSVLLFFIYFEWSNAEMQLAGEN